MIPKTLIAGAALTACGIAAAQSNVQLFGVVDAAVQHGSGSIADRTQLGSSGLSTSRIGFRGTESLGGDLWAGFWLEAGLNADNGSGAASNSNNQLSGVIAGGQGLTFNRRSTVSLGGNWGELRVGRDYSAQYQNLMAYDVTSQTGVGTSVYVTNSITGATGNRVSNSITYFMPKVGGFFGEAQYYFGENASNAANSDDGTGYGLRVGYGRGPWEVAVATSRTQYLAGDSRQSNIGGSYDLGFVKVMGVYARDEGLIQASPAPAELSTAKADGWSLGAEVPYGKHKFRSSYSQYKVDVNGTSLNDPEAKKWMVGWLYDFSKRTAVYGTYAHVSNKGGWNTALLGSVTGSNQSSSGYELGIRHSF